jgi:glycosyltransferase involved in cell wall biosynthesis
MLFVYYGAPISSDQDGNAKVVLNLAKEFREKHPNIPLGLLYISNHMEDQKKFPLFDNVHFIKKPANMLRSLSLFLGIGSLSLMKYNYDSIIVCSNALIDFIVKKERSKCVLIAGDLESRKYHQIIKKKLKDLKSYFISKLRERTYRCWKRVIFYNPNDVSAFSSIDLDNVTIAPLGIDKFIVKNEPKVIYDLIFTGNMSYPPNKEAANFIVNNIAQEYYCKHNEKLRICLAGMDSDKLTLTSDFANLTVKGFVPYLEDEILKAKAYVSPLFVGTGMKNKALQCFNVGVPLIGSPITFEGISTIDYDITVKDNNSWADKINEVLTNYGYYKKNALKLKSHIQQTYSWEAFSQKIYEEL